MNKLIKYKLKDAEFVAGEDEFCFKEVLEDFNNAEYINILTYNISANSDVLLRAISKAGLKGIPITIITNIPNRWNDYHGTSYRINAKKSIKTYERRLNPENIGRLAKVFFKFNNHGKIIMTNNIIYWGSANYSDESKKNYECGTLSKDKEFIAFVNNTIIPQIIFNSTDYYDYEYNNCLMSLYSALSYIHNICEEIFDASYGYYCDYGTKFEDKEYFNISDNYISWEMLENLMKVIEDWKDIVNDLETELIENEKEYDETRLTGLIDNYLHVISENNDRINYLCYKLEKMTKFNEEDFVNNLLQGEYYPYADEEHLDYYAQLAFERGREINEELIKEAEDFIKELLSSFSNYEETLFKFIDDITSFAKFNSSVDNTEI